jgi:hypothetical protein
MRNSLFTASVLALAVAVAPLVPRRNSSARRWASNEKVDTVSGTLEKTQERVGQNEARIGRLIRRPKRQARRRPTRAARLHRPRRADAANANARAVAPGSKRLPTTSRPRANSSMK